MLTANGGPVPRGSVIDWDHCADLTGSIAQGSG